MDLVIAAHVCTCKAHVRPTFILKVTLPMSGAAVFVFTLSLLVHNLKKQRFSEPVNASSIQ